MTGFFSLSLLFFLVCVFPSITSNRAEGHTNASAHVNDKAPRVHQTQSCPRRETSSTDLILPYPGRGVMPTFSASECSLVHVHKVLGDVWVWGALKMPRIPLRELWVLDLKDPSA